jgi:hypothetical protein
MPHCGGGGNLAELPSVLLTFAIVGAILYLIGILANILRIKFSNRFAYTPICWRDIEPGNLDNTMLGWMGGLFGFAFIGIAVIVGLCAGVYWCVVSL